MKLLFFKAPLCTTCHAIENKLTCDAVHIDVSIDQDTAIKYNVAGLPTFIIVDNDGKEISRCNINNVDAITKWYEATALANNAT